MRDLSRPPRPCLIRADERGCHEVPPGNPDTNGTILMKNTTKRWAIIAGASVASLGLLVGGTAAAGAAVTGSLTSVTHPLHHGSDDPTTAPTATPTPRQSHDAGDDNGKDAVDNDGVGHEAGEHATPEPGDDDAPGTADHHGGRVGEDNDAVNHHSGRDGGATDHSGPGRGSDDNSSGSGHGGSDDNGSGHGGHGSDD
jgi:hypothetical protein